MSTKREWALVATLALGGCAQSTVDDTEEGMTAAGALKDGEPVGAFASTSIPSTANWINWVNFHASDDTFEASLGNGLSNDSGHENLVDGTYAVDTKAGTIALTYSFVRANNVDTYSYTVNGDGSLTLEQQDGVDEAPFDVAPLPKPASLLFGADNQVHQNGALVAGQTVLFQYAMERMACQPDSLSYSPLVMSIQPDASSRFQVVQFPAQPAHGTYRALVTLPQASTIALWFEQSSTSTQGTTECTHWDNDGTNASTGLGNNYTFALK